MSWNFKHNDDYKTLNVKSFMSFIEGLEWCDKRLSEHGERWDGTELEAGDYVAICGKWVEAKEGDEITYEPDCPACENTCDCVRP